MDEENEPHSLGAYENMERPDIRPDFVADAEDASDETNSSDASDGSNSAASLNTSAKNLFRAGENAATRSKGNVKEGVPSLKSGSKIKAIASLKNLAPLIVIIFLLLSFAAIIGFSGQSLFAIAFSRISRQQWNTTGVQNKKIVDSHIESQLANSSETSSYGDVIYNYSNFSDYQIRNFESAGFDYEETDEGLRVLIYPHQSGVKYYIVADSTIEEKSEDELREAFGMEDDARLLKLSEALKDNNIHYAYITATNSYRGDMSNWYNTTADTTSDRLNISRNNWNDFQLSPDNSTNEKAFIEKADSVAAASEDSDAKTLSYEEMVEEVAKNSETDGTALSSAFSAIESVATADQTTRQIAAGSLWLESIDKTVAGEGNKAPLNASTNILVRSGGADTEGMHHLFGSKQLSQSSSDVQSVSAQANGGNNGSIDLAYLSTIAATDDDDLNLASEYRTSFYEGNLNEHEGKGIIVKIGSMFKSIGSWIKARATDIASFVLKIFGGALRDSTEAVVSALSTTIQRFNTMKNQTYFSGEDDRLIGEAMIAASERWLTEQAKSDGQTAGDTGAVLIAYREQQEYIAEQAEYERATRGQFDPTSQHTFLGKIAYSLIPFATSTSSVSLTSAISDFGSLISKSMASLLPTSSAVSETELQISRGDCVLSNSVGNSGDAYCINYRVWDPTLSSQSDVKTFEDVANMRQDEGGYAYGITENEKTHAHINNPRSSQSAPDYGKGPLNDAENNADLHWPLKGEYGEGTANGCESDWEWEYRTLTDANGNVVVDSLGNPVQIEYYFWDYPTEWKYNRITNFEYEGFKTGWPNRTSMDTAEAEGAKNDVDPGQCMLDLKVDEEKQPVINQYGALGTFLMLSTQRGSEEGTSDYNNAEFLSRTDFIKGRIHPCRIDGADEECKYYKETWEWNGNPDEVLASKQMSRWIGGSAYSYHTGNTSMMTLGYTNDDIFYDPTRNNASLWEETKLYQAYVALTELQESADITGSSNTSKTVLAYLDEHPLDNSYAGVIARFSGLKKDTVIAVLDFADYVEFLANYDPSELGPIKNPSASYYEYDNSEIVAKSEEVIIGYAVVYDELRNRAVAA